MGLGCGNGLGLCVRVLVRGKDAGYGKGAS